MSTKYKFTDKQGVYFTTSTVAGWTDVFIRDTYREILLNSIRFCQKNQGLTVHAWALMTNHLHMISSCKPNNDLALILRNIKSFTALKLIDAIINNPAESRKEHMLNTFEAEGKKAAAISGSRVGNTKTILFYWIQHWHTINGWTIRIIMR